MTAERATGGWAWFESSAPAATPETDDGLPLAFAKCFAGPDGEQALGHLERIFLDRRLGPSASDAELRHLEGQRSAVAYIKALIARGRG